MAQSGNGAACESDVTSLGTGQELNFDDDTLKGKRGKKQKTKNKKPSLKLFNKRKWLKRQSR